MAKKMITAEERVEKLTAEVDGLTTEIKIFVETLVEQKGNVHWGHVAFLGHVRDRLASLTKTTKSQAQKEK